MQPTEIINANAALEAPARWDAEKHGECAPLPVRIGDEIIQSAWVPSLEELAFINAGGHIVLTVFGYRMTPVSLHVEMETPKAEAMRTELAPLDPEQALRQILALITPVNPEPGSLAYKAGQLAVCALEGNIPAPTSPRTIEEIAHTICAVTGGNIEDGGNPLVPVRAVAAAIARGDLCDQPISSPIPLPRQDTAESTGRPAHYDELEEFNEPQPPMQRKGKIELTVVLGILHIDGQAVTHTPKGRYIEPSDLKENCRFVIDIEKAEAIAVRE